MRTSKTEKTVQVSSSTDEAKRCVTLNFTVPTAWRELSQWQLRLVFDLMARYNDNVAVKCVMLVRFCDLRVISKTRFGWRCVSNDAKRTVYLPTWQVQQFIHQFDFIDQVEFMDGRLDAVCGLHAADALLHGVSFDRYLHAEKYYQMVIDTGDMRWLDHVAMWLYHDAHGRAAGYGDAVNESGDVVQDFTLTPGERVGTLLWYGYVKRTMSTAFPHFFRKRESADGEPPPVVHFIDLYNAQMRALTGGDVTKEKTVLALDCWRALTELEAKAREAEELERKIASPNPS